ncbi:hypothetical protein TTHERM_00691310 (macronuclear) [Tetrahymena thermophila SB210]|uniref:Uncharacterized protein n=1 Tax=Tetrahymena thermophila (strain SB210) TaxID=312017 RepID=I7LT56_TETTS|nr:hypothetical protein TTHERM_00691310 [Tetrahymena thermophila SB210]EAR84433.2 hypothetical protein TTHERM_00691310 [Tetrahymena thermophila SB210]|eukprot:XP_001032096.2 hypothetical protein TTHERM_00691310 [Tetrahymena thermophila SB210]
MDSTYQFSSLNSLAFPLKSYGLPSQSSTYQANNLTGTTNLDDQVKAIAMQYQYSSTYKPASNISLPQVTQQIPNQITSSLDYNSSLPNSNQSQGIYQTNLGNNTYQYQKLDQKIGTGLENNSQYGQIGGIQSQIYGLPKQYVSNLGNSVQDTDYKQNSSFQPLQQQQQAKSEAVETMNDQSREQFRLKVDEIVNQVKKSMYYQSSGADSNINTNFVNGQQQKQQQPSYETNFSINQNKLQTPLKYSQLSSDLNKVNSSYNQILGINNLKQDSSPMSNFNAYDKLNKTFNSVIYQGSQLSSSVPIQLEQKNQNFTSFNDQIGKEVNNNNSSAYNFSTSQANNTQIQNNQLLQASPYQQFQKQNIQSEQSLNMQNSYKQLSPLNKIQLSDSYNLKTNYDNQNTLKNYDFTSNFSKQNPLLSSFDKSSINYPQYDTKSYVSSNVIIQGSGISNPTALAQKVNIQSEIPSELQSVNLKYSYTANQIQDLNYYQSSLLSNQDLYKQTPVNIEQAKQLVREKSIEKTLIVSGNSEESKIQQPGQQYNVEQIKRSSSFSEKKNSLAGSPNKQSIFSNLNSQNINSQNDQIVTNNNQFFSDVKDDDTLNQLSQQNNTFETLQNETQNIEAQSETVKRSKNNQQISHQSNSPSKESIEKQIAQRHSPKSSKSNKQNGISEDKKDEVINEEQLELNQWLDPVFQDFIKKNFSKEQKKRLILQLQKQISCDGEDLLDEQEESKQSPQSKQHVVKKIQKTSSSSRSPKGSPTQQQTEQNKKTLNLYERYNKLKHQKIKEDNKQSNKQSQIIDIKNEEQQLEYIQFSQRCKEELEKQQKMQKSKIGKSGLISENGIENINHIVELKNRPNIVQSMESLESNENMIMTKESKLLLQEIYNEVQNALKKYDYIIQENQKNRKNQDQTRKDQGNQNSDTNSDILNNGITAYSLQSNNSQMRFETQNQEQEDQSQKQKKYASNKNYYQSKTPQNFNRKNMNQTSKSSLSSVIRADNKNLSINMNQHSDSHSTIIASPIPNQENSPTKDDKSKGNSRGMSNFDGQRISKMDENEAESAFNNRKQEIIKVLQHHSKQRKNSIQQKPMNHSISKGNNLSSHVRTPSNSISQRNIQTINNQNNEYDLNNSSTSGNKQKANSLLNKFLSPKNNVNKSKLQQEVGSPSQSLKASLFLTKDNQSVKSSQHFDKKAYQLSEQQPIDISQKKENDKKQQTQDDKQKMKAIDVATVNSIITDSIIPLEKVKKASKGNDESKQKIRKKSILQINLLEKEAFEINIADLDKKKKQSIKEKKEKIEKIYNQAQQSISNNEKQLIQKRQSQEQPNSDKNIQLSQLEVEGLANSNSQRQFYQNQILSNKFIEEKENNQNIQADPERLIKRSNSASYNILQQKKLAILNDIEDLNKMIEQENQNQEEILIFEQPQSQQNIQNNEEKNVQNKQNQEQKKQGSRQSSKHQSQPFSRKSSTNHYQQPQNQQENQYPKLAGFTQTKSVTEFYSDNQSHTKLVAPLIPLTKIRDQDSSDVQSFQESNNEQDKDANFQLNKEKFLQQLKQQNTQSTVQKEVKRVNSQHVIQNKDSYQQIDRQSYGNIRKKENQQKENNQANSASKPYQKNQRGNIYQSQDEVDQEEEEVHQINIYRSLSPNRYQQSNSQTNFHERNKKWLEDKKSKMEETQKNYNYKEMKECTFKPQTNKQLIKYNPYIHKDQIKQQKGNNYQQNNKSYKASTSPRNLAPNYQQKNPEQQQLTQENYKQMNTQSSRNKKDSEDLQRLQGLQSPIVQRYSEVEFWSQSDASVFKAINDIDTSYQNELKKEISDVLDIIQGFQNNVNEKTGSNSKQPLNKKNKVSKEQTNKLINSQKFKI